MSQSKRPDLKTSRAPFAALSADIQIQTPLRAAITAAHRLAETDAVSSLVEAATLSEAERPLAEAIARDLVTALRAKGHVGPVAALMQEYALSSQEGVALMCLAEALLRIPDAATRDALIRDKIALGDWMSHVHHSPSFLVNAATWGLVVTGKITETTSHAGIAAALHRFVARAGEPIIRASVDVAMRMLGQQFVRGQTIDEALASSRELESRGFRYSYDMLGEAAMTAEDAARYFDAYEGAIHAIGKAAEGAGIYRGPGISIKLSALHPRYARSQRRRVMAELLPRLAELATLARSYDIGLNIDAEEADRLDISLDLLEALCADPAFAGWNGVGFVVQAYQKRCPTVIDYLIDLARRTGRRLMIRLVKGAYWDSEIKRAQIEGQEDFPVFTRKVHTDVSYLACAKRLLAAPDAVFPQFATHNAQTLASIVVFAGAPYDPTRYEFQCLHGMGEPLYQEVVGTDKMGIACRIYAPVGPHETLLAYLVRRLLENGANTSFVNRIADPGVPIEALIEEPAAAARRVTPLGAPHPVIRSPRDLFGAARRNSAGFDFNNEKSLAALASGLAAGRERRRNAKATADDISASARSEVLRNPADGDDLVGTVEVAAPATIESAFRRAKSAEAEWAGRLPTERAALLFKAADIMERARDELIGIIVREAGKSLPNALGDVREAIDFLRYYGAQVRDRFDNRNQTPLGTVVCISPWNFPLAIFVGQVAAALAVGNVVLAKPAEETPLIAAAAVDFLHEAGIPRSVLQLLPGAGEIGAALVADPRTNGVMFTGSTAVARLIRRQLAERLNPDGAPVPLIAETGGQNAMVVDSSALPEQVVGDVVASAFDSAGQRCSALRLLCLQDDIADRVLEMLRGALAELRIGRTDDLATDIGPVISASAKAVIETHVARLAKAGFRIARTTLPEPCEHGTFVAPTIVEIDRIGVLEREVFGPVLHVLRFKQGEIDTLIDDINATGYALTFGLHTRIEETVERVLSRISAGNVYVNRNIIGAVVGVQPFGGHGLSGTGPKAGGPLYLARLAKGRIDPGLPASRVEAPVLRSWIDHVATHWPDELASAKDAASRSPVGASLELPGPVGERNTYEVLPRGTALCIAETDAALRAEISTALATGNRARIERRTAARYAAMLAKLPEALGDWVRPLAIDEAYDVALFQGSRSELMAEQERLAKTPGPIIPIVVASRSGHFPIECLVHERSISVNTAAAGGNASLMSVG